MKTVSICWIFACLTGSIFSQSWKQAANDSIIKYRTTPLKISILDEYDQPLKGVTVHVELIRHQFIWGSIVSISEIERMVGNGNPIGGYGNYYDHLRLFNSITPENAGKWKDWINPRSIIPPLCRTNPSKKYSPSDNHQ